MIGEHAISRLRRSWSICCALTLAAILGGCQPGGANSRDRIELAVPFQAQETLLCVPTSAAMVLAFYGDAQSPRRLKALSLGHDYLSGQPFSDFSITSYDGLVHGVAALGYRWSATTFPMTPVGYESGLAQIKADLRAGRPSLVDVSHDGVGHTFVISGFDDQRHLLYFVDPASPAPGRKAATYDQFAEVWNETAYGGRFRALIRTVDKDDEKATALRSGSTPTRS